MSEHDRTARKHLQTNVAIDSSGKHTVRQRYCVYAMIFKYYTCIRATFNNSSHLLLLHVIQYITYAAHADNGITILSFICNIVVHYVLNRSMNPHLQI